MIPILNEKEYVEEIINSSTLPEKITIRNIIAYLTKYYYIKCDTFSDVVDEVCKQMSKFNIDIRYYQEYKWRNIILKMCDSIRNGKLDLLKAVKDIIPEGMKFSFAEQKEPLGNGHAILMAKEIVGKRDFIVMWPDDIYINFHGEGVLKQLADVYAQTGGIVENIMEFPKEEMVRYGALIGAVRDGRTVQAKGLVEKPKLEEVPSNYASMGPYILPNVIMDILPEVKNGSNGEINLTDALNLAAERGVPLTGVLCRGLRFDCGTNDELARANLKLSLMLNPNLRAYAKELLDTILV